MLQFKKIAADKRTEGKGKKKKVIEHVNGGGDYRISEEEFELYFPKVMKVRVWRRRSGCSESALTSGAVLVCDQQLETAHASALFRAADTNNDGFLEYRRAPAPTEMHSVERKAV